ncbi:MAG: hypothetical protein KDE50_16450, partial [Caldilineaceae bacterium]|nr:hypothetical protein [Caldilineaceae bacterium]
DGLALEVTLTAQSFADISGDLTRTLMVNAAGTMTPAVFVLTARAAAGPVALGLRLEQIVAETVFTSEIATTLGGLEDWEKSFAPDLIDGSAEL